MSWIDKEYTLAKLEAVLSQYIAELDDKRADAMTEAYHIVDGMDAIPTPPCAVKSSFSGN